MSVHEDSGSLHLKEVEDWMEVVHEIETQFKVILLGDSGVGKTSLAQLYQTGQVQLQDINARATVGFDCYTKNLQAKSGALVKVQIWDTAGMERFRQSLTPKYYELLNGVVMVYDITNYESFEHLELWMKEIKTYCKQPQSICMALVGNKADNEIKRKVANLKGSTFAQTNGMRFEELSAKEMSSVGKLNSLIHSLMEQMHGELEKKKEQIISSNTYTKSVIELDNPSSYAGPSDRTPPAPSSSRCWRC